MTFGFAAFVFAACGDDGAATDAAPVDAPPVADSGPTVDGGNDSPYERVSCGSPADGGVDGDAGLSDGGMPTDGGVPPGLGDPCCNPDGACPGLLVCLEGPDDSRACHLRCDPDNDDCPGGSLCADFGSTGVCIPASEEGEDCAPELCDRETICVGDTADNATCKRRCENQDDCDTGTTCTDVSGSDSKACL